MQFADTAGKFWCAVLNFVHATNCSYYIIHLFLHYWGYQITFCNSSKSCLSPLANFRRIIEYRMQFDWICMRCSITLYQLAKRAQKICGVVAKGVGYPLDPSACGNRELHVSNIPLGELYFKKLKKRLDKQILSSSAIHSYISRPIQPLSGRSNLVRRYL